MRCAGMLVILSLTALRLSAAPLRDVESLHYHIHTDLEPALASDLAQRLDVMFDQYSARLADLKLHTSKRFEVYLYAHRQDYLDLTENVLPNSGGMFLPDREILTAYLEGQGRDYLRRTLQHEAFHQFASIAFKNRLPVWLNEGIAQTFEEGIWTGKDLLLGQVSPQRLRQVRADVESHRFMSFEPFMQLDHAAWRQDMNDLTTGQARYCQAWAMTHYLIFATDGGGKPLFRQRLIDMLDFIRKGHGGDDAWVKHFGNNYDGFQRSFEQYLTGLQPTPAATYVERQNVLADLMFETSKHVPIADFDSFQRLMLQHKLRLQLTVNGLTWSSDEPETYFHDLQGRAFTNTQLHFGPVSNGVLPDLICAPVPAFSLRTIFHPGDGKADFETIVRAE